MTTRITHQVNASEHRGMSSEFKRHVVHMPIVPISLRAEVKMFCAAAETLLSPVLLGSHLNEEERGMIRMYIESLQEKNF